MENEPDTLAGLAEIRRVMVSAGVQEDSPLFDALYHATVDVTCVSFMQKYGVDFRGVDNSRLVTGSNAGNSLRDICSTWITRFMEQKRSI